MIISLFINLRQSIKVISNKEYPEIEGCSQTVPVWLFCMEQNQTLAVWLLTNMCNQCLLHNGLLFAINHWTASVQLGLAFMEADIQPIMKNPISFRLAIDENSLESYLVKETIFVS